MNWQKYLPTYEKPFITVMDVGQGECILFQTPENETYMIDGGSTSKTKVGIRKIIPCIKYYGINKIDYIFLTHWDADHMNGIVEIIEAQKEEGLVVENLVISYVAEPDENYRDLVKVAQENGIRVHYMVAGDRVTGSQIQFNCLHPAVDYESQDRNHYSLVLEVQYGEFKGLFTGDISMEQESEFLEELQGPYDVYKAAHHGSMYSNSREMLDQIDPVITVISCGLNNRYGHPGKELIEYLQEKNIPYFITMNCGATEIYLDKNTGAFSVLTFTDVE